MQHLMRFIQKQFSKSITKAIISPVVSDNVLPLSNTAYNSNKYSRLVVTFILSPFFVFAFRPNAPSYRYFVTKSADTAVQTDFFAIVCFFTTICDILLPCANIKIFLSKRDKPPQITANPFAINRTKHCLQEKPLLTRKKFLQ